MFIPFTCRRLSFSPRSVCFFSLSSKAKDDKQYYFAVSYVINSCGLSPESAISASGKLHSKTPERPDSVLTLFRDYGITSTHIPELLKVYPTLLRLILRKPFCPNSSFSIPIGFQRPALGRSSLVVQ